MNTTNKVDVVSNRKQKKYETFEQILRIFWFFGYLLFKSIPRSLYSIRACILRVYGADIGRNTQIYPSAHIYFPWKLKVGNYTAIGENAKIYNLGEIILGDNVTVSQNAHLCAGTHDYENKNMTLIKSKIYIGDNVWVCADSFVGPGSKIEDGAVIGARSVVFGNVERDSIMIGNPAKCIRKRNLK